MRNRGLVALEKSLAAIRGATTSSYKAQSGLQSLLHSSQRDTTGIGLVSQHWLCGLGHGLRPGVGHGFHGVSPNRTSAALPIARSRYFSSSAKDARSVVPEDESNALRFAKYLVFCMLIAAGVKVLPTLGQNSVEHALMLTESKELFWRKAGVDRMRLAAKSDKAAEKLINQGAALRLVNILEESSDSELTTSALQAVEELSRLHTAREAFVVAGAAEALATTALRDSKNRQLANELLVAYKVQQDHVD